MKVVVLGDTHGRTIWKEILENEKDADKIIFIGDYFDSRDPLIDGSDEYNNLVEIIEAKKADMDRIILLLGNHDLHYLIDEQYSGYQHYNKFRFNDLLVENEDLFQVCYIHYNYLFTHAGVSSKWLKDHGVETESLDISINQLWKENKYAFEFQPGRNFSNTGDDITQGPMWIRLPSLMKSKLDEYIDVVGHTSVKKIDLTYSNKIIPIDALANRQYLRIIDLEPEVVQL